MTFTELVAGAAERLNITGVDGLARIGRNINTYYKRVTSSLGIQPSRRTTVQATATLGVDLLTFDGITKIHTVQDRSTGRTRLLDCVRNEEINDQPQGTLATKYAIYSTTAHSVTIRMNAVPQTAFVLYAEVLDRADTLLGTDEPAFAEDFHDLLISAAVYEERLKMEKPQLAMLAKAEYEDRLNDLRYFLAKEAQQDIYQGKRTNGLVSSSSSSSGGATPDGASSYTQTGLITFNRQPSLPPFAVTAPSAKVTNLDADKLDGTDWTTQTTMPLLALPESQVTFTDITTGNGTSTKHGFAPKSPADATKFLNGASTPAYAQVKDSDLSTSDITTNDASTSKHGFLKKLPNTTTTFLDGTGAFDSITLTTDVTGVLPTANGGTSVNIASAALPLGSGQITFPSTQNPSANANTLDDYEEGSWTPVIGGSGGTSGQTYTIQAGLYTKIGKLVIASFVAQLSAKGTITALVQIQGLPFTLENTANNNPASALVWLNTTSSFVAMMAVGITNTTTATIFATTAATTSLTTIATTDLSNTTAFEGVIMYRATA